MVADVIKWRDLGKLKWNVDDTDFADLRWFTKKGWNYCGLCA